MCSGHISYFYNFPSWFVESCKFQNWIPCQQLVHTRSCYRVEMSEQSFSLGSARKWNHTQIRTQVLNDLVNGRFEKSIHCIRAHPQHSLGGPLHKVHTAKEQWERTLKHCSWAVKQPALNKLMSLQNLCAFSLEQSAPPHPSPIPTAVM